MWAHGCILWALLLRNTHATSQHPDIEAGASTYTRISTELPLSATEAARVADFVKSTEKAPCTVYAPEISVISWVPEYKIIDTATITVGIITTLVFLCNETVVATRTQIDYHWDAAPADRYPPYVTTNNRGHAVAVAAFTNTAVTSVVELVFPNSHIAYDTRFSWEGILSMKPDRNDPLTRIIATDGLSTTDLARYIPFSRDRYPEPTVRRTNISDVSGRGYRPLWVHLDNSLSDSFSLHLGYIFYNLKQTIPVYRAYETCERTVLVSPTPSFFYEAKYSFAHATISIDLDATGTGNTSKSAGKWRNSTASGKLCRGFVDRFAGLCAMPEVHSIPDECTSTFCESAHSMNASTPLEETRRDYMQTETEWGNINGGVQGMSCHVYTETDWDGTMSGTNLEDDRTGYLMRSRTAFETTNNIDESTETIRYATDDWITDGAGGVITTANPQTTQFYRSLDVLEAEAIYNYLKTQPEKPRIDSRNPQETQSSMGSAQGQQPIEPAANDKQPKERPENLGQTTTSEKSVSSVTRPWNTDEAHGLEAIRSVFNKIFFHTTPANFGYVEASSVDVDHTELTTSAKVIIAAEQAVKVAENIWTGISASPLGGFYHVQITTTVNGIPTTSIGYVISATSTVMVDQRLVINGKFTMLTPPDLLPMYLTITKNGIPTSTFGYIISGRYTATVGQTITLNDRPIVLTVPDAVFSELHTVINGLSTTTPVYIISGISIASIGQRINLDGTTTVLAAPEVHLTYITTTVNGAVESGLAFIITSEMTATIGQTVTVGRSTMVLAEPTNQPVVAVGAACGHPAIASKVLLGAVVVAVLWMQCDLFSFGSTRKQ